MCSGNNEALEAGVQERSWRWQYPRRHHCGFVLFKTTHCQVLTKRYLYCCAVQHKRDILARVSCWGQRKGETYMFLIGTRPVRCSFLYCSFLAGLPKRGHFCRAILLTSTQKWAFCSYSVLSFSRADTVYIWRHFPPGASTNVSKPRTKCKPHVVFRTPENLVPAVHIITHPCLFSVVFPPLSPTPITPAYMYAHPVLYGWTTLLATQPAARSRVARHQHIVLV